MAEKSDAFWLIPLGPKMLVWAASVVIQALGGRRHTTQASVRIHARYTGLRSGPRLGRIRLLGNGVFRRNGTRRLSTTDLGIAECSTARFGRHERYPGRALFLMGDGEGQAAGRTAPPNSPSQCFQKPQCF
jgi:hypothetical protein